SVSATGGPPLTYQWMKNGNPLSDGGTISGSWSTDLYIAPAAAGDSGNYSVTISNPCGDTSSVAVTLLVCTPTGDTNGDGLTNGEDVQSFVNALLSNTNTVSDVCAADFGLNLAVDSGDIAGFVAATLGE
ncbi:MAG TPA: immunoglobulin domain-containing protein, partial [Phycisphaerae bacterium]|nr:immunoglobulin domain-containing protein [Phycisphaerae bacterium]